MIGLTTSLIPFRYQTFPCSLPNATLAGFSNSGSNLFIKVHCLRQSASKSEDRRLINNLPSCNLLRVNNLPPKRYLTGKPSSRTPCWTVSVSVHRLGWLSLLQEAVHSSLHRSGPMQTCHHELPHHCYQPGWTAKLCCNFPNTSTQLTVSNRQMPCRDSQFVLGISLGVSLLLR